MTKPDEEFWEIADSFIEAANRHTETASTGKVSAALMYAAARFNTYALAEVTPDLVSVEADALEYLGDQYRKMCMENIADHTAAYKKRRGK
jgi:hypothetical protein